MFNFLMLQTSHTKELAVAEAIDRIAGVDSSYCPLHYETSRISRYARQKGVTIKSRPVIPRHVFITASFPDLKAVSTVQGAERIITNPLGHPEVIPSWQMAAFMEEVEKRRLWCLKMAMKGIEKAIMPTFHSFAELEAWFSKANIGETIDENGEILPFSR